MDFIIITDQRIWTNKAVCKKLDGMELNKLLKKQFIIE